METCVRLTASTSDQYSKGILGGAKHLAQAGIDRSINAGWNAVPNATNYEVEKQQASIDPDFRVIEASGSTTLQFGGVYPARRGTRCPLR